MSPAREVRGGAEADLLLIGLGTRGRMWARVIGESAACRITAAVDPSEDARRSFVETYPEVRIFSDIEEALQSGTFQAALLVTPPEGHLAQCRLLFAARVPTLAEKPLAVDLSEAVEIVGLAEASGVPLSVGLNFRYLPVHQKQRQLLGSEFLGEIGFGEFLYRRNRDGRRPGINKYPLTMRQPMMLEQTIHHLDLIRFCYGREVQSLACRTWNPPWSMYAHDANVDALLTLEGGIKIHYFGTWSGGWNEPGFEWRTDCASGVLVQRELFSDLCFARTAERQLTPIAIEPAEAFFDDSASLLREFLEALRTGSPVPCGGRDHLRTLALCFAGIESSETGRTVHLAEFYDARGLSWLR